MGKAKRLLLALASITVFSSAAVAHAAVTQFHLQWTDNSDNEDGFRCYQVSGPLPPRTKVCDVITGNVGCPVSADLTLAACYVCTAYNVVGESADSNTACAGKPAAPGTVHITVP